MGENKKDSENYKHHLLLTINLLDVMRVPKISVENVIKFESLASSVHLKYVWFFVVFVRFVTAHHIYWH